MQEDAGTRKVFNEIKKKERELGNVVVLDFTF